MPAHRRAHTGTVDAAELFVAILLVSHKLNKLPLGRKIEPPTKAQVQELLHTETRGDTINREQFLRICQRQFVTMGEGILLNVFLFLIMVPFLGVMLKGATQRLFLRAEATWMHGAAVKTPDSVFAMVVSTVVTLVRAHGGLAALRPSNRVLAMALVVLVPVAIAEVHRIVMPVAQKHGPALAGGLASTVDKATGLKKRAY